MDCKRTAKSDTMSDAAPDPGRCKAAIKLLEQFERLAKKYNVRLPRKRLEKLRDLRDTGAIDSSDLPAKLRCEFPSDFIGMNLAAIHEACKKKRNRG